MQQDHGSIYISAAVKALEAEANDGISGGTQVTTNEFAGILTKQLVNVIDPRFGTIHDHQFEVQNNAWTDPYHKRTSLLLFLTMNYECISYPKEQ